MVAQNTPESIAACWGLPVRTVDGIIADYEGEYGWITDDDGAIVDSTGLDMVLMVLANTYGEPVAQ